MSSMGIAPSSTLSPNIAETRSQQNRWLCELSSVAPALPRSVRGGAAGQRARRDSGRGGAGATARPRPGRVAGRDRGGRTTGAQPPFRQEAGNLAKTIS